MSEDRLTPVEERRVSAALAMGSEIEERTLTVLDMLNSPKVLEAYATLIAVGLISVGQRATIFCAYCGDHICFDLATGEPGKSIGSTNDANRAYINLKVAEHRKTCPDYQDQLSEARGQAFERDLVD
jgi:hypothetical protein